jgi:hypothetical protein
MDDFTYNLNNYNNNPDSISDMNENDFEITYNKVFPPDSLNIKLDLNDDNNFFSNNSLEATATSNSQHENNNQNNNNSDDIEQSKPKNKRGRKADPKNKKKKKSHTKEEKGNINSKIKNNFHNFIIYFLNKEIRDKNNDKQIAKFRKIAYEITNIRNKDENKKLLNNKIKDLCNYNISPKYKNKFEWQNKITSDKIYPSVKKYLEMTYKDFYNDVFLNPNNNNFKYSFKYFIDKWHKKTKDDNYIEKLIKNTKNYTDNHSKFESKNKNTFLKKKRNNKKLLFSIEQK